MPTTATIGYTLAGSNVPALAASTALSVGGMGGPGRVALTGSGTYVCDVAFLPSAGAKGIVVLLDAVDDNGNNVTAPITIRRVVNGVTINDELSAAAGVGGFFGIASPSPTHATTALSILYTAACVVHVYILG